MSADPIEAYPSEACPNEDVAPAPVVIVQSFESLQLRLGLIQDQLRAAAIKVNMLHGMGLDRTSGYADAFAAYEAKLADFNDLKARLGL